MDKREILNMIHSAILEVAPYALDLLTLKKADKNQGLCFVDLGINSINYAEIAHIVMGKLHVDYPLDVFTRTNRIDDVVEIFYDLVAVEA
jgi:hypothetical protein